MKNSVDKLLDAVSRLVKETHPSQIARLASCIDRAGSRNSIKSCVESLPANRSRQLFKELLDAWETETVTSEVVAGMLLGASHAYDFSLQEESIELVWTGPSSKLVATRKTEQALIEVIDRAKYELFLVSFVVYAADTVIKALRKASDRGVSVSMLLEPDEEQGGQVSVDSIRTIHDAVPDAHVCTWIRKEGAFVGGKVHAKLAVADGDTCFISSANLTEHAMEKNMEAGVLVRRGDLPDRLNRHLKALITIGVIQKLTPKSVEDL